MKSFRLYAFSTALCLLVGFQLVSCGLLDEEETTTETVTVKEAAPDTIAPTILFTVPVNGDLSTSVTGNLKVVFSEAMDNTTVNNNSITLRNSAGTILQTMVTYDDQIATVDPTDNLSYSTDHFLSFSKDIADTSGNKLGSLPYAFFKTAAAPDTTAPTVTTVSPTNGATAVPVQTSLMITFGEDMELDNLTPSTILLADNATKSPVTGTVDFDSGRIVKFTPNSSLTAGTTYEAKVLRGVEDTSGNGLNDNYTWTFITASEIYPSVSSVVPDNVTTGVALTSGLTITFDTAMDLSTLTTTTILLEDNSSNSVAGSVSFTSNQIAVFTPSSNLSPELTYTATVTTGAQNASGVNLLDNYTWSFTTSDVYPVVSSTVPDNATTGIAINADIRITFDVDMDLNTLTTSSISIADGGVSVAGLLTYANSKTVIFTPSSTLSYGTTYTVSVSTAAKNAAGVPLETTYSSTFSTVTYSPIASVNSVSTGEMFSCAVFNNRTGKCWGLNNMGALGDGTLVSSSLPVSVSGLIEATAIDSGARHSCALTNDRTIRCWGDNQLGQAGDGSGVSYTTPVTVSGISPNLALEDVRQVTSGVFHNCAILQDYTAVCWGLNNSGELGDGSTVNKSTPVAVSGSISNFEQLSAGGHSISPSAFTCGLVDNGTVYCWGENNQGQLGDNSTTDNSTPDLVMGLTNVASISAGGRHVCAVQDNGSGLCWGDNLYGQLGDNSTTGQDNYMATNIVGNDNFSAISAGYYHTCGLLVDSSVRCWGDNRYGQLGDNSTTNREIPTAVSGITSATAISSGDYHTCAVLADQSVKCWGYNNYGQLGDNTQTNSVLPVNVVDP